MVVMTSSTAEKKPPRTNTVQDATKVLEHIKRKTKVWEWAGNAPKGSMNRELIESVIRKYRICKYSQPLVAHGYLEVVGRLDLPRLDNGQSPRPNHLTACWQEPLAKIASIHLVWLVGVLLPGYLYGLQDNP
eukprot:650540-Amphidinium_carterae.1